ncbi:4-fold beta flower protein [Cohnella faecalis]|uniref:4-fold beta flower domain-containing protein n=1 Tax=Cohnella faecalis TaxID=2315694 RepID=A0A398CM50_9BACL|nr:hypothetical protein [Cohnella faecalis]RIE04426.1 hypothetical protein D3H35_07530 [Cohnella faecalis]
MNEWYFDRFGQAMFVIAEGDRFVSRNGRNLGWLKDKSVYTLTGRPVAWLDNGVMRDGSGNIVAFARSAAGVLPSVPGMSGAPGTPSLPGRPPLPGFAGTMSNPGGGGWGSKTIRELFGTDV